MKSEPPRAAEVPDVNLKRLSIFSQVGEVRRFREVARLANRSPSAVSSQIQQLEAQLGVESFGRTTRSVRLRGHREDLLVHTRRAAQKVADGLRKIRESADALCDRSTLSCAPTVAAFQLAEVLVIFERACPGAQIQVRELAARRIFNSVRRQEVDFAIGPVTDSKESDVRHLCDGPLYVVVSSNFSVPQPSRRSLTLKALSAMPLLILDQAAALRKLIEDAFRVNHLEWASHYQVCHVHTLLSMTRARLRCAILPQIALPQMSDRAIRGSAHHLAVARASTGNFHAAVIDDLGDPVDAFTDDIGQGPLDERDDVTKWRGSVPTKPRSKGVRLFSTAVIQRPRKRFAAATER